MDAHRHRALGQVVLAVDALLVLAAMPAAAGLHAVLRHHSPLFREPPGLESWAALPPLALPLFLAWIAGLRLHRLRDRPWPWWRLLAALAQVHLAVFLSMAAIIFLTQSVINRSLVALFLATTFGLLLAERLALLAWHRWQHATGGGRVRVLVAGAASPALDGFLATLAADPLGPQVLGRIAPDDEPATAGVAAPLARLANLEAVLRREAVDHVLFFPPLHRPAEVRPALRCCETVGVPASFQVELPERSAAAPRVVALGRQPFVTFEVAPKPAAALAVKHGADAVVAALLLALLAPLLAAIALSILVTMGRPVLFVQERAGLFGRRFRMLKFRTMERDAEARRGELQGRNELSGPVFKLSRDPRVTWLGAALRRTSLDELPQLVNVLLGQMSLVGPRPLPLGEQEAITGWQRRRLSMKPGLTGLWQVSGRSGVDFDEWMRLDLEYVDHWTLTLDLLILLRTIPAVLLGRGAR